MKDSFYIFKRDLTRILKNKVAVIVMIGVCIIPSLYAWFNIAANMDPYANTNRIKVAIINNDVAATSSDITINAGKDIVKNLKANRQLDWKFVSRKDGLEGVKSGKYYAAIVIPEDFSKSLLSIASGDIKSPSLSYYVNEKKNAIAPKITSTGASTIQEQINETFSSVAAKTVSTLLKDSALSIYDDVADSKKSLNTSLKTVRKEFDTYASDIENFKSSTEETKKQLGEISDSIDQVNQFLSSGKTSLDAADKIALATKKASGTLVTKTFSASAQNMVYLTEIYKTTSGDFNRELGKVSTVNSKISSEIDRLSDIIATNDSILKLLEEENASHLGLFDKTIEDLKTKNDTLKKIVETLKAKSDALSSKTDKIKASGNDLDTLINTCNTHLAESGQTVSDSINTGINPATDRILSVTGQMRGVFDTLPGTLSLTKNVISETQSALDDTISALTKTETLVKAIKTDLDTMSQDLTVLESSKAFKNLFSLKKINSDSIGNFIESPVEMDTTALYPVKNYGSAMAPFYTNLALWVGGIVLVSVIKLEVDTDPRLAHTTPSRTYMGRLFLLIVLSVIQGFIVTAGDIWLLKVQCVHPGLLILAGILCSVTFTNIIFSLAITFKHIGKALCVLFIILQIPGGSGTYPIEMTPPFFQALHPLLPFTYGIAAMREAIAGLYNGTYSASLLKLLLFIPVSLIVGLGLRLLLLNLNNLFDAKLSEADIMISEHNTLVRRKPHLDLLIKALISDDEISLELQKRKSAFERTYKKKVKRGLTLMCTLPLVFLVLMFFIKAKSICLILWIISMIATAVYLIILEYINNKFSVESSIRDMSREEILEEIKEGK